MAGFKDVIARGRRASTTLGMTMALLASTLIGCNNVSKEQYDALAQENEQIRQQLNQQQVSIKKAESEAATLRAENDQLRSAAVQPSQGPTVYPGPERESTVRRGDVYSDPGRTIGTVNFASGADTLDKSMTAKLDSIASTLKSRYSGYDIRVEGHADGARPTKGKHKSNEALSEARADAVKRYLVQKGISNSRITTVGRGSTTTKVSRDGRRADVVVIGAN